MAPRCGSFVLEYCIQQSTVDDAEARKKYNNKYGVLQSCLQCISVCRSAAKDLTITASTVSSRPHKDIVVVSYTTWSRLLLNNSMTGLRT